MSGIREITSQLSAAAAVSMLHGARKSGVLQRIGGGAGVEELRASLTSAEYAKGCEVVTQCQELSLEIIPFYDPRYPLALRAIPVPPAALFIRASTPVWEFPLQMISIVGTRAASVEMCQRASLIALHLAQAGFSIVSGLALGVDGAAHRGALAALKPCSTIAVLAHGLDRTYPSSHARLAESIIAQGGCLISEYPPGVEPLKHHFLERNRIIAGLSRGVVVIEAGERSGSLVTARNAADFGRDVFVLEGAEGDARHSGGAKLIDDGAIPVAGAREIFEEYGVPEASASNGLKPAPGSWETLPLDIFLARTNYSAALLLRLEMDGRVVRLPGNRVSVLMPERI